MVGPFLQKQGGKIVVCQIFSSFAFVRFEAISGNTREANRGSAFSPEASLEQAGSKQ